MLGDLKEEVSGKGFIYHAPQQSRGSGLATWGAIAGTTALGWSALNTALTSRKENKHDGFRGYGYPSHGSCGCAPCASPAPQVVVIKGDTDDRCHRESYEIHRHDEVRGREEYRELGHDFETKAEAKLGRELACKEDEIARLKAEMFAAKAADRVEDCLNARINGLERRIEGQICGIEKNIIALHKDCECCKEVTALEFKSLAHAIADAREDARVADRELRAYADCTFVPQEKGFMDGRRVNFHRCEAVVGLEHRDLCVCGVRECDDRDRGRRNRDEKKD